MTAHLLDGANLNCCTCCNSMSTCLSDNINLCCVNSRWKPGPWNDVWIFKKKGNLYHYIQLCILFSWIGNSFSKFAIVISYRMCKSRVRIEIQMNCVPVNPENKIIPNPREWISQFNKKNLHLNVCVYMMAQSWVG